MKKELKNIQSPSIESALKSEIKLPKQTYSDKLKNPLWQKKRLEIMQRDNFECKCCFSNTNELNVHHFNYQKEPWQSEDFELITLCKDCHKTYHEIYDKYDKSIIANLSDLYWNYHKVTIKRNLENHGKG